MEKKYIIKLEENEIAYKTVNSNGCPMIGLLHPAPYTEPDLEQVREDAFKNGYDAACKDIDIKSKINAAYRKGMEDAWDAARTLWNTTNRKEIFGYTMFSTVLTALTAQEAVEKIRQYEQEKKEKEEIQVGDEVNAPFGKAIVVNVDSVAEKIWVLYADGHDGFDFFKNAPTKTGRHFPEIAEALRKMRE